MKHKSLIAILCSLASINSIQSVEPMIEQNILAIEEKLFTVQSQIFDLLKQNEARLLEISRINKPLRERWQMFLQVLLPIQIQAIQAHGYSPDQTGLSLFNEEFMKYSARTPSLFELNKQKWLYLYKTAFNVTEFQESTLEEVRTLIIDIADQMTSESFLEQIDLVIENLEGMVEKRQALLTILFPLHMSIMEKHGYPGEEGYIQAQRAIMEYYYDPLIQQTVNHAQLVVFKRAKLLD